VVFNVGAGHGQADEVRATLQAVCAEAGRPLHLLEVRDPLRLGAIAREAVAQAQHGIPSDSAAALKVLLAGHCQPGPR